MPVKRSNGLLAVLADFDALLLVEAEVHVLWLAGLAIHSERVVPGELRSHGSKLVVLVDLLFNLRDKVADFRLSVGVDGGVEHHGEIEGVDESNDELHFILI